MPVVNRLAGDNLTQVTAETIVQNDGRPAAKQSQTLGRAPPGRGKLVASVADNRCHPLGTSDSAAHHQPDVFTASRKCQSRVDGTDERRALRRRYSPGEPLG